MDPDVDQPKLSLSSLSPAQPRKDRKRVGRGLGSGKGRYSGRGIKGQKSRAGSHKMRAGFEGGQMPLAMRIPKLRGNTSRDAMPIGPFRTYSQPVNIRDLERFEAGEEVTPETLKAKGLIRSVRKDVKLLGVGELDDRAHDRGAPGLGSRARQGRGGRRDAHAAQGAEGQEGRKARRGQGVRRRRGRELGGRARDRGPAQDAAARERRGEAGERAVAGAVLARQRMAGSRAPAPGAVHRAGARGLPARHLDPGAGRQRLGRSGTVRRRRLRAAQPVQRRRARALLDLRARDHAVRHGLDRPPADGGRGPVARAAAEGGRVGLREDQPVHALPDRRARGAAGGRVRLPLPPQRRAAARRGAAGADRRSR